MEREKKLWLTPEGHEKLEAELEELRTVKRPATLKTLQEVRGGGDWRGDSQSILLQNELARIDAEIARLEELLEEGEIVEAHNDDKVVDIGETVVVQIDDETERYTIVGPAESDPDAGRISYESPLGRAFLKHRVGDELDVEVPAGSLHYRIVAVHQ
jgi:transcription elongation factor GreA